MNSLNEHWQQRDLQHVWHPCTQMKDHETNIPLIPIQRGKGVWLYDFEGKAYLDAISSWWVNLFGHGHPYIQSRIQSQLSELEHVLLAGFTHRPVIELSEQLVRIAPKGLEKCFYTDNGSSAVEAAIKMSFHFWKNHNQPQKKKFVCLSNSYHGETLGALSVGNVSLYKETYGPLLFDVITAPSPDAFLAPKDVDLITYTRQQFEKIKILLEKEADCIAAVIIEPLVQCAGNMRMYHPLYLTLLRECTEKLGIHFIADEIAVGFGRTGTLFACEQAGISPDFLCLSKGLTGGFLPLAVVMTTSTIYQAFYDDYHTQRAFLHSHSYTGNPLACSAALATIELFEKNAVIENNQAHIQYMKTHTEKWRNYPYVADVRQTGMIVAVELMADPHSKTPFAWQKRVGLHMYREALQRGILLRPLGDVIYLMPPYVISEKELSFLIDQVDQCLQQVALNIQSECA